MELSELKKVFPRARFYDFQNIDIGGISYDSRQVKKDDIFVAISGNKTDGHKYIADALHRGAVALVTQHKLNLFPLIPQIVTSDTRQALAMLSSYFYNQPSSKINVIGVTGTNGKSTVTYLIKSILEANGEKVGLLGTIQYVIGARQIPAPVTTPESYELQGYFNEMRQMGLNYAVMEVSSHSLVQNRIYGTMFRRAVFTNLTRDHLDFHKTMARYRQAKSILFRRLPEDACAILNADDSASRYFERHTRAKIIRYGLVMPGTDVSAVISRMSLNGSDMVLRSASGAIPVHTPLIGRHNVYNILAAAAAGISLEIPLEEIKHGIEAVKGVRGRLETVATGRDFSVVIDYAHTDDALHNVMAALKPIVKGRLIVVFGCGGDRDRGKRPLMGKIVEKLASIFIITSDNPRTEDPLSIIDDIKAGLRKKKSPSCYVEPDRYEAIKKAILMAKPNDLVLIAGKGHETGQIFKDVVKPFDDKQVAIEILEHIK
ncbi:MAG: UDP-N-acetylmuramoyl-L-alanyl-D-glutamate--2,6-diaminopimelate ligase [Planctomycetes bacterium]|nr:UDP-N-acetylmuramoyl-L-alanyl-D-glutamate--2,6-diaminopimelate ligase [Planctomycetota bacterium]